MKKTIHFYCLFIVAVFIAILIAGCSQETPPVDPRLAPKILSVPRQKMMVAEVKGDPNKNAGIAYTALLEILGKMREKMKGLENPTLRARYPLPLETPPNEKIGIYGLTVPESFEMLPEGEKDPAVNIRIEYWEYGDVGEILHIGPYAEFSKSEDKLKMFSNEKGYEIAGPREQEYIKYEGMVSAKDYETMLRFRVI